MDKLLAAFQEASQQGLQNIAHALDQFSKGVAEEIAKARPRAIAAADDDANLSLDAALFDSAPTVAVPKHAAFAALQDVGHRFLMTADGVFIEVRRPWLHVIQQLSKYGDAGPRPPYGTIEPKIELAFGRLSAALPHMRAFAEEARNALPNEHAAWIVWNHDAQTLEYVALHTSSASPNAITYDRPALRDGESLAIDLHSHGADAAFFSEQDNADDVGEVKVSAVFGGLGDGGTPSVAFRLCVLGMFVPLKVPASAIFTVAEPA